MPANLVELIGREKLWAVASEVAALLEENPRNIVGMGLWSVGLWVARRHELATIISYRQLPCWIPLLRQAILDTDEFQNLEQLREALEADFNKRGDYYAPEVTEELRQLLEQRRAQLQQENAWRAEVFASGYASMIERCRNRAQLEWVRQVIREQDAYMQLYPNLNHYLEQIWEQQASCLQQ